MVGTNVGIGTTSPGAKLEVDGNLLLTPGSGASITFSDGSVQSSAFTGTVYSFDITSYSANGNVSAYTDTVNGTWSNIGYDALNRLSAATGTFPSQAAQSFCWSYDDFGNRTMQASATQPFTNLPGAACVPNGTPTVLTTAAGSYNSQNQLTGGAMGQFSYEPSGSGNITNDGRNNYIYDDEGRICAVQSPAPIVGYVWTQYIYDAEGNRVAKGTISTGSCDVTTNGFTLTNTYALGQGGEQVSEVGGDGQWLHSNAYVGGSLLATYDDDGVHFQISDWLGSRRVQTDWQGKVEETYPSLPFGEMLPQNNSAFLGATEQHFTGKERDTESGNDDFGARYYNSNIGRWMSADWAASAEPVPYAKLDNPQTLNLYAYVGNNPLVMADADGHEGACTVDNAAQVACSALTEEAAIELPNLQTQMIQQAQQSAAMAQQQGASSSQSQSNASRAQTQLLFAIPYIAKQLGVSYETAYNNLSLALTPDGQPIVIGGHANFVYSDMATVQRALENANEGGDYKNGSGDKFARLGSTPSTHLDKVDVKFGHGNDGLIHLDRFNGGNPKYTLQHFGYDVVLGHIYGSTPMLPY